YPAALRRLGNPQAAEEIAQAVFCSLAQKAWHLPRHKPLIGWLYQTTCFKASNYWRGECRRRRKEEEAVLMNIIDHCPSGPWEEIAPVVDEAIGQLNERDRLTVLLRFFEGKSLLEVGKALGVSEDAARMRINRSLDKLRDLLLRQGVHCSALVLATVLLEHTVQAVPVQAAQSIR